MGWQSSRYGHKSPAPAVSLTVQGPLPRRIVTAISLGDEATVRQRPGSEGTIWICEHPSATQTVELAAPSADSSSLVVRITQDGVQVFRAPGNHPRPSRGGP